MGEVTLRDVAIAWTTPRARSPDGRLRSAQSARQSRSGTVVVLRHRPREPSD